MIRTLLVGTVVSVLMAVAAVQAGLWGGDASGARWETHYFAFESSLSGDRTAVAAVAGYKIVVMDYTISCAADETVAFQTGASTHISGVMSVAAKAAIGRSCVGGCFETAAGELLAIEKGLTVQCGGHGNYLLIAP